MHVLLLRIHTMYYGVCAFVWMNFVFDCRATVQSCWTVSESLLASCACALCIVHVDVFFMSFVVAFNSVYFILLFFTFHLFITPLMACFQHNKRWKGNKTKWLDRLMPCIQPQFRKVKLQILILIPAHSYFLTFCPFHLRSGLCIQFKALACLLPFSPLYFNSSFTSCGNPIFCFEKLLMHFVSLKQLHLYLLSKQH